MLDPLELKGAPLVPCGDARCARCRGFNATRAPYSWVCLLLFGVMCTHHPHTTSHNRHASQVFHTHTNLHTYLLSNECQLLLADGALHVGGVCTRLNIQVRARDGVLLINKHIE